jgi:hypothetical protein
MKDKNNDKLTIKEFLLNIEQWEDFINDEYYYN